MLQRAKKSAVFFIIWQCLQIVFCLSVTFSSLSLLDTRKAKSFHVTDSKLAGASTSSQSLSLGLSHLQRPPLSLCHQTCRSERGRDKCSSHFLSLCFTLRQKNLFFAQRIYCLKLSRPQRHQDTFVTTRPPCYIMLAAF